MMKRAWRWFCKQRDFMIALAGVMVVSMLIDAAGYTFTSHVFQAVCLIFLVIVSP